MNLLAGAFSALSRIAGPALFRLRDSDPVRAAGPFPDLLYIHIPFCREICPYCSFVKYPFEKNAARVYFQDLKKEIGLWKSAGAAFTEIYVGGGSPGVDLPLLAELLSELKTLFPLRVVSVETNPDLLEESSVRILQSAGVDRLSVGIQSLDDGVLKTLGRLEKYGTARSLVAKIREFRTAFSVLNADMIFRVPGQTERILRNDLGLLLEAAPGQTTFYPLMTTGTKSHSPGEEERFYGIIRSELEKAMPPVSVWCFGGGQGTTDEYVLRHAEYAGTGCGAFSFLNGSVRVNSFSLQEYGRIVDSGLLPVLSSRRLSGLEQTAYELLTGFFALRLHPETLRRRHGGKIPLSVRAAIGVLLNLGWVREVDGVWDLTSRGRYPWLVLMKEFFQSVNHFRSDFKALASR